MLKDYFYKLRRLSRNARILLATGALLGFTVFGGIYTVLLNLYLIRLGYGARLIGLINGAGLLSNAVFSLPVSAISERVGMRRMLIGSMLLAGIGFVALPFAEFAPTNLRPSLLLASYVFGNLGITVWIVNAGPFMTTSTGEQERSYAFSLSFVLASAGAFTGSLVASFLPGMFATFLKQSLSEPAPYRATLLLAGILLFAGIPMFVAADRTNSDLPQKKVNTKDKTSSTLIITMSLVVLLSVIAEGTARTFFNVYLDTGLSVNTARIGALSAIAQLMALPTTMAMPILAARIGKRKTILLGHVILAMCLLPMALLPHWLAVGSGFIGMMMFASFSRPVFIEFQQESVKPRWRTAMSGATTMTGGIGNAAAALGGGYLVTTVGYRGLFLVGIALTLAGMLLFYGYFVAPNRRPLETTPP